MNKTVTGEMKILLADPAGKIKLDDFVTQKVRKFIEAVNLGNFPVAGPEPTKENFLERLKKYEELTEELQQIVVLLARWGDDEQILLLEKMFNRLAESDKGDNGKVFWIRFGWYPILILMYSAGIAAISAKRFSVLKVILETPVIVRANEGKRLPLGASVPMNLAEISDAFKWLPDQERKHTPRSRHLRALMQPVLEELLFLGKSYEDIFDEFETYYALVCAQSSGHGWFPVGIFAWKYNREDLSPFHRLVGEAEEKKEKWPPLRAGFFGGSFATFKELSEKFKEKLGEMSFF